MDSDLAYTLGEIRKARARLHPESALGLLLEQVDRVITLQNKLIKVQARNLETWRQFGLDAGRTIGTPGASPPAEEGKPEDKPKDHTSLDD
jgi:hypothetical protein